MVFSSPVFLFCFLPFCLLAYWAFGWRSRSFFLIVAGCIFYLAGSSSFLLLLLATIFCNYVIAKSIKRSENNNRRAKSILFFGVFLNILSLFYWKYSGFASKLLSDLIQMLGGHDKYVLSVVLPIGISFYTFQCVSFLVDVYRKEIGSLPRFRNFAAFIFLFPHLIAGPIVRFKDIEHELTERPVNRLEAFSYGAPRFFWGLAKKILIADQISLITDRVYSLPNNQLTFAVVWIGVVVYALQIYFDFSGYSDMAIGLAQMFGFRFKENFNRPYSSHSLTDFWRRWHISLSSWFRDYLYVPLGGNRRSNPRTYFNLLIVFALTGFWHGAQWTFLAWGLFHGVFLVLERLFRDKVKIGFFNPALRRPLVFIVVCFGWAIFRATSIDQAWAFVSTMIDPSSFTIPLFIKEVITNQRITWISVGLLVLLVPRNIQIGLVLSESDSRKGTLFRVAVVSILAPLTCVYALTTTFSPFLYFQF
jgi:alginate O-acetyltransferase complex protein AlgI